jgi:hypothetical protein
VAISEGYRRDRAVDESGNQVAIFGRRGARPFNLAEMDNFFMRNGQVWTVHNAPPGPASTAPTTVAGLLGALWALLSTSAVTVGLTFGAWRAVADTTPK